MVFQQFTDTSASTTVPDLSTVIQNSGTLKDHQGADPVLGHGAEGIHGL